MIEFEKSLNDYNSEVMCIGCILLDHTVLFESSLSVSDFYSPDTKMCFKAILELYEARKHIDAVTIHSKVSDDVNIDTIYEYSVNVHSALYFKNYHDIVIKLGQRRSLLDAANKITALVYSTEEPAEISQTAMSLVEINQEEDCENYFEKAVEGYGKGSKRIAEYGITKLDTLLDGIHPGRLTIIGARPHVGKTYISCHIAQHIGFVQNKKCMYFSMEMTGEEIADRLIANALGIGYNDRLNKKADEIENMDFTSVIKMQQNISIKSGSFTIDDIVSKIRHGYYKNNITVFIVDHLGLIVSKGKDTRNNEIGSWTARLKQLTLQLGVDIILLSQLNRGDKSMKNARPTMESLRDSGNIEQDADNVVLLHRDSDDEGTMDNNMSIIVAKNRVTGIKGICNVAIYPNTFSIIESDVNPLPTIKKKEVSIEEDDDRRDKN